MTDPDVRRVRRRIADTARQLIRRNKWYQILRFQPPKAIPALLWAKKCLQYGQISRSLEVLTGNNAPRYMLLGMCIYGGFRLSFGQSLVRLKLPPAVTNTLH